MTGAGTPQSPPAYPHMFPQDLAARVTAASGLSGGAERNIFGICIRGLAAGYFSPKNEF